MNIKRIILLCFLLAVYGSIIKPFFHLLNLDLFGLPSFKKTIDFGSPLLLSEAKSIRNCFQGFANAFKVIIVDVAFEEFKPIT